MKFEIEKSNFKVPDKSTLIHDVKHVNVVKYNHYYKVQLVSDEVTWSIRFAKAQDVTVFLSSLKPGFIVIDNKLDKVIENQEQVIENQERIIEQNEKMLKILNNQ